MEGRRVEGVGVGYGFEVWVGGDGRGCGVEIGGWVEWVGGWGEWVG